MASIAFPPMTIINPSYTEPRNIIKYNQSSQAFSVLPMGRPEVRLSPVDKAVYAKTVDIRTKVASGQQPYEELPSVSVVGSYISTPTYLNRNRFIFNHHDANAAGVYNVAIDQALTLGSRQAHFQRARDMLLWGVQASNGEGLANAAGITTTTLPPDSNGNSTFVTYDNGQLGFYLLGQIVARQQAMFQLGMEPLHTVILGPQRILGPMRKVNIVQLVQFQRQGAGTLTTGGMMDEISRMSEDSIEWGYDDTLQGQGSGASANSDLIFILLPTVKNPHKVNEIDTNEFSRLMPGWDAVTAMFCDMAAPREIRSPLAGGAIDVLLEWLLTPGWVLRPEGVLALTVAYQ